MCGAVTWSGASESNQARTKTTGLIKQEAEGQVLSQRAGVSLQRAKQSAAARTDRRTPASSSASLLSSTLRCRRVREEIIASTLHNRPWTLHRAGPDAAGRRRECVRRSKAAILNLGVLTLMEVT